MTYKKELEKNIDLLLDKRFAEGLSETEEALLKSYKFEYTRLLLRE